MLPDNQIPIQYRRTRRPWPYWRWIALGAVVGAVGYGLYELAQFIRYT